MLHPAAKPEAPLRNAHHRPHLRWLVMAFAGVTLWSGFAPRHRQDWLLENMLVAFALPVLYAIYRRLPFSRLSWTFIFLFLCLHEVGAHYTYSEVPYDDWCLALTGTSLSDWAGWERNHFDRVIHVFYGLFLAYPVREIFLHLAKVRGFWSYFLPLDLVLSSSALYEMIEWGAAAVFGGDLGAAYLGTQGDPWDAQKDMAFAAAGAAITMTLTALINWRCQRDFAREWSDSLTVNPSPCPPPAQRSN